MSIARLEKVPLGGDYFIDTEGFGKVTGPLLQIPFDNVASLADGVAASSIQARLHVPAKHRLRGVVASASGGTVVAAGTDPAVDVYRHLSVPETAPTVALISPAAAGNVDNGAHKYGVIFVNAAGNTTPGPTASVTVADKTTNGKVVVSDIPIGPTGTTARIIVRTKAGATQLYVLDTIADNTTTTYTDNTADSGISVTADVANTAAATVLASTIKLSNTTVRALFDQPLEGTLASGVCTDVFPACLYTLRCVTGATTGAVANVRAYLLVELVSTL